MNLWAVVVNCTQEMETGWTREFQMPTFFVQAFNRTEAETKAMLIVKRDEKVTNHVSVERVC